MNTKELRFRIERYVQVATVIFNIKREYITLGVPVLIALLFIVYALFTGHTYSYAISSSAPTSDFDIGVALSDQFNQTIAAVNHLISPSTAPLVAPKYDLDQVLVIAFMIATIPYTIDVYRQKRILKKKELEFSNVLYKLSELMRGGIDPVKGMIAISKGELGILKKDVQDCASSLVLGHSFKYSMNRLKDAIGSKLIAKYVNIVVQASHTGGNVSDLVFRTSEDMRSILALEKEKEGNLKQYVFVFYMAQGILLTLVYELSSSLLPMVKTMGTSNMFGSLAPHGSGISDINFQQGFFHLLIINALFGGLIIGMITEGDLKQGLKHSNILILSSYIMSFMLILAPALPTYIITVASGDNQHLSIGDTPKPITFNVSDTGGKPATRKDMTVTIEPRGSIESTKTTDYHGQVTVHPVIDNGAGTFKVRISSGKSYNYTYIMFESNNNTNTTSSPAGSD